MKLTGLSVAHVLDLPEQQVKAKVEQVLKTNRNFNEQVGKQRGLQVCDASNSSPSDVRSVFHSLK